MRRKTEAKAAAKMRVEVEVVVLKDELTKSLNPVVGPANGIHRLKQKSRLSDCGKVVAIASFRQWPRPLLTFSQGISNPWLNW